MKTKSIFQVHWALLILSSFFWLACNVDEEPPIIEKPSNDLGDYNLPGSVQGLFDTEVLKVTGSLVPFIDRIQKNGMKIYQGDAPPEIFKGTYDDNRVMVKKESISFFNNHDCVYDEYYPSYKDSTFGGYIDQFFFSNEEPDISFISYSSVEGNPSSIFPAGMDQAETEGIFSGDKNNFTLFFKVDNGLYNRIRYTALWIYSGTIRAEFRDTSPLTSISILSNVTKCFVLVNKSSDPNNEMANVGTIRIFRDDGTKEGF